MVRALELLLALGALDSEGNLTPLGQQMVRLPVEPVFARVGGTAWHIVELHCTQLADSASAAEACIPATIVAGPFYSSWSLHASQG